MDAIRFSLLAVLFLGVWGVCADGAEANELPIATIDSISPSSSRFDSEVTFNGTSSDSDGFVVAYEWYSSIDGLLSTERNFSLANFSVGNHTILFRVQDNDGAWSYNFSSFNFNIRFEVCVDGYADDHYSGFILESSYDSEIVEIYYLDNFIYNGLNGCEYIDLNLDIGGYTLKLYDSDDSGWSNGIDGGITVFDFAGNILSDIRFPRNTGTFYETNCDYQWLHQSCYRVTGGFGLDYSSYSNLSLLVIKPNELPFATIDYISQSVTKVGVGVFFGGSGIDKDGTIAKYEWDFDGDGIYDWSSDSTGATSYIYSTEGLYIASLRVTSYDGFTDIDSRTIVINNTAVFSNPDTVNNNDSSLSTLLLWLGGVVAIVTVLIVIVVIVLRRRDV